MTVTRGGAYTGLAVWYDISAASQFDADWSMLLVAPDTSEYTLARDVPTPANFTGATRIYFYNGGPNELDASSPPVNGGEYD